MSARALLYDRQAKSGLVGSVFRQDSEKGAVFINQITVPIVDFASDVTARIPALDSAEAGRYLVQFTLPDGQIMTESFDVAAGEETELVVDLPHDGPHEWSSLESLTGQIWKPLIEFGRGAEPLDALDGNQLHFKTTDDRFQFRFFSLAMSETGNSLVRSNALQSIAELIDHDVTVESAEVALMGAAAKPLAILTNVSPAVEDDDFALFELVYMGCTQHGAPRVDFQFGPGTDLERAYLIEKSDQGASLICLPSPWMMDGTEHEIRILLDKRSLTGEPRYTLTIAHPTINNALGYIRSGAMHEAAKLIDFETAQKLLFHKISSPLAAAFGGYLLLLGLDRNAYSAKSDQWQDWVDNLANWFDWLPDGAILKSAKYFVLGDDDRDGAYDALMIAYDRGLPYFTFGLNLMLEGMRRFANEGDAEAQRRLKTLETIAAVTDPSQNFLSIAVSQRWHTEEHSMAKGARHD